MLVPITLAIIQLLEFSWHYAATAHRISYAEELTFPAQALLVVDLLTITVGTLPVVGDLGTQLSIKRDPFNRQMNQPLLLGSSRLFLSIHL
ncbi:hypothetical protein HW05_17770 [Pseudomonas aeruginosa]|nr:hypothetical protein HW05_17770 [Pseudomonas aeruginosa]